jgi:hypothetical protein
MKKLTIFCYGILGGMLINGAGNCMEKSKNMDQWQGLAIDATPNHPEGEHLSKLHRTSFEMGYYYQMPESEDTMKLIVYMSSNKKWLNNFWRDVLSVIHFELGMRCWDGDQYFIDKYLERMDKFLGLTNRKKYENVVAPLFVTDRNAPFFGKTTSLCGKMWQLLSDIHGDAAELKNDKEAMIARHALNLNLANKLDALFTKHDVYKKEEKNGPVKKLPDAYKYEMSIQLPKELVERITDIVLKSFKDGVSISYLSINGVITFKTKLGSNNMLRTIFNADV